MNPLLLALTFLAGFLGFARAEDASAILKVRSNVVGAEVFVDGEKLGVTPMTKYLVPGTHQVRVVADRHDPFVRRVELAKDTTFEVQATLVPGSGTVEFVGAAGAKVYMDGVEVGQAPIRLPSPSAGAHRWKVAQPGFEAAEGALDIVAGRNYLIPVALESSAGVMAVTSVPAGARVRLDGAEVGVTPLKLKGVASGRQGVEVPLEGHARALRAVDTTGGVRGAVDVTFVKGGSTLVVATGHAEARVFVNDVPVGGGPEVRVEGVERGRAKVRVESPAGAASSVLTLPAEGALEVRVAGSALAERRPLTAQWPFWAGVGGALAASGVATAVVVAANQPEPTVLPSGDTVVVLP